jgi:phosphoribosylformimino-5-aminoimidazole carboxamide ribonucleotide (ProFAR) isomerase
VPFTVLPALDVSRGRLVVLGLGGPQPTDAFGEDPAAAAASFDAAGATWVHVVDVDRAIGRDADASLIATIRAAAPHLRIQVSGGIVSNEIGADCLAAGADRFVLASGALSDPPAAQDVIARHGDRVVLGIEVEDGRVRGRGTARVDLDLMSTLGWLHAAGAPAFLVTSIRRVGALGGPDLQLIRRVARVGRPVIAAGGVRTLDDLVSLRDAGAAGAVAGRSVLEGTLELADALTWAAV